jgi:single-strand DNA-binding protein
MNSIFLIGRAGKDPVCKEVGQNNTLIAEFSVATSEPPRQKGGEWTTTWHSVKCFSKTAEKVRNMLRKGDNVALAGRIEVESWEDKEGNKKSRTVVLVRFDSDIVIEPRSESRPQGDNNAAW